MKIEVTELVPIAELEPGDIFTDKPQEWWDEALAANRIGVVVYIRSEFPIPDAYLPMATHKVIVHQDEDGVEPSTEAHVTDEAIDGVEEVSQPFHCKVCGGMGTDDSGDSCGPCQGTGVDPNG